MSKDEYKSIQEVNDLLKEYQKETLDIENESKTHQRLPSLNIHKTPRAQNTRNGGPLKPVGRYASMDSREANFGKK